MTSKVRQWALAGVAAAAIAPSAFAQDAPGVRPLVRSETSSQEQEQQSAASYRIVVTGTNIANLQPESTPLSVYSAEDIRDLGAIDVQEFIRLVPQNLTSRTSQAIAGAAFQGTGETSFDLRGLGPTATLTLLNGRRLALGGLLNEGADVSLLPLAALDRVEILTDGASSIYGSDAIAGVVNFITRTDFQGAETNVQYETTTDGGYESARIDQTLGTAWSTGNILGSLTYATASPLDAEDRDYVSPSVLPSYLSPVEQRYSGFLTGHQELTDQLKVFGDFLYTKRDVKDFRTNLSLGSVLNNIEAEQYFANIGARYQITDDLGFEFATSYSDLDNQALQTSTFLGLTETAYGASALDVSAKIDGKLFELNGSDVLFVVGGGSLTEDFSRHDLDEVDRETAYAFAEVQVPLVSPSQDVPLVEYFDVNLSGRYTDIKDVDDSFDPKVGLAWALTTDFKLRGTYSESFRAPPLPKLHGNTNDVILYAPGDAIVFGGIPTQEPIPSQNSIVLLTMGSSNGTLLPEESENFTVGFDITPRALPGLEVSATYWDIDFTNRIAPVPAPIFGPGFAGLEFAMDPSSHPDLIDTTFTLADVAEILSREGGFLSETTPGVAPLSGNPGLLDPAAVFAIPNLVIVDARDANLAVSQTNGLDFSLDYTTDLAVGRLSFGGVATYILEFEQKSDPSAEPVDLLNTVFNPVDFRGRAYLGLAQGAWNVRANLNYVSSYEVSLADDTEVDSWTTLDLLAGYRLESIGNGLQIAATVKNVFDEDPPFVSPTATVPPTNRGVGFDNANADPFGRVMGLQLTQTW